MGTSRPLNLDAKVIMQAKKHALLQPSRQENMHHYKQAKVIGCMESKVHKPDVLKRAWDCQLLMNMAW